MQNIIRILVVADDCVHPVVVIGEELGSDWEFKSRDISVGVAQKPVRRAHRVEVIPDDVAFAIDVFRNGTLARTSSRLLNIELSGIAIGEPYESMVHAVP